ncbi:MAG: hypothetical protein COY40_01105 [Alphaproteobacteria bacterium CG_4_10_14_0_8_um_filter_53_9]|nr:MAG: hypothetical protein COY40_01105 [Alphaproteobacteria bacterium CG_4_10_14_0_8_um_filter_53_9]
MRQVFFGQTTDKRVASHGDETGMSARCVLLDGEETLSRMFWALFFGALFMFILGGAPRVLAADTDMPVLVEVFTNKNCPNCPANEKKLKEKAAEDSRLLVVFSHVDYWDKKARTPDPFSLAEATARQYDYSNTLGRRPGEVFTPQPILNGAFVAAPPLFMNWGPGLSQALGAPIMHKLKVSREAKGGVVVDIPEAVAGRDDLVLWVMGVEKATDSPTYHLRGLQEVEMAGENRLTLRAAMVPEGEHLIAVLQKIGPSAVVGLGQE